MRMRWPRQNSRPALAIISGEIYADDVAVLFGEFEDGLAGAVGGSVDDQHDLIGMPRLFTANGGDAPVKLGDPTDFIVARHDNRQPTARRRVAQRFLCMRQKPSSHG